MASSDENSDKECPLCMEALELDDLNFYPCSCQYQICRFCWHRIRTDENGLCPACRQPYPEDPVNFKPLSAEDLQKIKNEKKLKVQKEKQKVSECRKHLANLRVLQKNLVYVVGLSPRLADSETLKKAEYFGRFGKIHKVVVVTPNNNNCSSQNPVNNGTAYVTYYRCEDALKAITNVNNVQVDGRALKACLGTTKYCSAFLRNQTCHKQECMYLHEVAEDEASFTKEDMHQSKHADYERRLLERYSIGPNPSVEPFRVGSNESNDSQIGSKENEEGEWHKARQNTTKHKSYSTTAPKKSRSVERLEPDVNASLHSQQLSHSQSLVSHTPYHSNSSSNCQGSEAVLGGKCGSEGGLGSVSPSDDPDWPSRLFNSMHTNDSQSLFSQDELSFGMQLSPESARGGGDASTSNTNHHQNQPSLASLLAAHITANFNGPTATHRGNITSEDPAVVAGAPLTPLAPPTDWQAAFGLKPETYGQSHSTHPTSHIHDDDLGFDPFSESAKGLADLLEQEKQEYQKQELMAKQRLKLQHLAQQSSRGHGWPAKNGTSNSLPSESGQFIRNTATSPIPHNFNTPPPGFIPLAADCQQNGPKMSGVNLNGILNGLRMPHQQMYNSLSNRDPSPTSAAPASVSPVPPDFGLKELQALLPNVNVRFAPGSQTQNNSQHKTSPSPNWLSCPPPPLGIPPPFNQPPPPLSVSTNMAINNHVPMRPSPPGPPDALFSMPPPPFGAPPRPMPPGYPPGTGWPSVTPPPPPGFSPRQQSI